MESPPVFSIIIPAFMAAEYLGGAIQSVLDQTFPDFEVIVVNDASPDGTASVVKRFVDPRVKYLVHETNRGLPATRNTGIRASTGKYIAFLDHDDQFLPEKLACHYSFLEQHPEVGATYNSHFQTSQAIDEVQNLWVPPKKVSLSDLILGYPFSPSDVIFRREALFSIGLLDETNSFHGEDLNTNCRLALAGCRFARIDRALNYRRIHAGRTRKDLEGSLKCVFENLEMIFSRPECPREVIDLRNKAYANNYLVWSYMAFAQEETLSGQLWLREAMSRDKELLNEGGRRLMDFYIDYCIDDDKGDLPAYLEKVLDQLPAELLDLHQRFDRFLAQGYLLKAIKHEIWRRSAQGQEMLKLAVESNVVIDERLIGSMISMLMNYRKEFGTEAVAVVLERLVLLLNQVSAHAGRRLSSSCYVSFAFDDYHSGLQDQIPKLITSAMLKDPSIAANRGALSIFVRSLIGLTQRRLRQITKK